MARAFRVNILQSKRWNRSRIMGGLALCLLAILLINTVPFSSPALAQAPASRFDPAEILIPDRYQIEVFATGLTAPSTAVFDGNDLLVAESGSGNAAPPRVLRIKPDGSVSVVASTGLRAPVMGLALSSNRLYVSHRGKVSLVQPDGRLRDILTGLPSDGDYSNNNIVFGPDGQMYLGQGTITNAGVVGIDNFALGWLETSPALHEIPCEDVITLGQNFRTPNPLSLDGLDALTGAYQPFGSPALPDQVVKGDLKCGGSIVRFNSEGGRLEVVAWGLRDPFGLKFDSEGQLWATNHGTDPRGSRSILGDPDTLVDVQAGAWYGWPDYVDGKPVTEPSFQAPGKTQPTFLWEEHPPLARGHVTFQPGEGANGLAFSPGGRFGFEGDAFVAMIGNWPPLETNGQLAGARIARVDVQSRRVYDFASNQTPGPAFLSQRAGFNRPSDVVFGPDESLYVIDWGEIAGADQGSTAARGTGAIWRIYPKGERALRPSGAIAVPGPSKIGTGQGLAGAPPLASINQEVIGMISLVIGAFGVGIATIALLRRYLQR